jgi:hypothetical protein
MRPNSVVLSTNPLIIFSNESSLKFKDRSGYTIQCKVNDDDIISINSGWCFDGWWEIFLDQLNQLADGRLPEIGYGGSEGNFSVQFTVNKNYFRLSINNFGERMGLERTYLIRLNIEIFDNQPGNPPSL